MAAATRPDSASDLPKVQVRRRAARRPARFTLSGIRTEWPLLLVLAGTLIALLLMIFDRWRRGAFAIALVAIGAAVLRVILPEHRVGLLAVRSRWFDVAFYILAGLAVGWLSLSVDSLGTG